MADWYPGAIAVPVGGNGDRITIRPADNVLHIAASSWNVDQSNPRSLAGISGWIETGDTEAHTYNDQFGFMLQYCSLFDAVNGTKDGNYRNRTHEAWNPPDGDLNESGYTPEQCERFSDFLAWDHLQNGAILRDMRNSLKTSHGVGVHRYGIKAYSPWKDVGGEVWSTSTTKLCPGTKRVNQLGGILVRAQFIADNRLGTLPPGRVNLATALARGKTEWSDTVTEQELRRIVAEEVAKGVLSVKEGTNDSAHSLRTIAERIEQDRDSMGKKLDAVKVVIEQVREKV